MAEKRDWKQMGRRLHALAVLRGTLAAPVPAALAELLDNLDAGERRLADLYCTFVSVLYAHGGDLGAALLRQVQESDNPAVRLCAAGKALPPEMRAALAEELATFTLLARLSPAELRELAGGGALPAFANTPADFAAMYAARLEEAPTRGWGAFYTHHMFTLGEGGALCPVQNPDPQQLAELTGYAREREQVLVNTRALLRGLPAANILLYGDAGTGKSSTVKAIANEYRAKGLRLVEVRKNQLYSIPALMSALSENPLKFILFIDDLSFPADDGDFTALKAILEGNVSARPANIVVYATSNRRHMVRQRFSDRQGDDVNLGDTLEEEASLSARFGLTVTFLKPDRELYLDIVKSLAAEHRLKTPEGELLAAAEAHALRYGGRSPRTARQFVEYRKALEEDKK